MAGHPGEGGEFMIGIYFSAKGVFFSFQRITQDNNQQRTWKVRYCEQENCRSFVNEWAAAWLP